MELFDETQAITQNINFTGDTKVQCWSSGTIATRTGRDLYSSSPVSRRSWVRIPLEPQNFVLGFICYCTTAKISFTSILYLQFTHMIFIIYTSHNCNCLCYFLLLQFQRAVKTAVLRMVWFISEISFAKFLKFARSFFF